jgi:hypothetical protein
MSVTARGIAGPPIFPSSWKSDVTFRLQNRSLAVDIDKPGSVYCGTRFDWTGIIRQVTLDGRITFCAGEAANAVDFRHLGCGICNEFGIDRPVGYADCPVGGEFLKIGVGLLTRQSNGPYQFSALYPLEPARHDFKVTDFPTASFRSECRAVRGYACRLSKTVSLEESRIVISYRLENIGSRSIQTSEYCHNFIAMNDSPISPDYRLEPSFDIHESEFGETVNPGEVVEIGTSSFGWKGTPEAPFFFSNVGHPAAASSGWRLRNTRLRAEVRECVSPAAAAMNLWGAKHVVSPELFVEINLSPGETMEWQRRFEFLAG